MRIFRLAVLLALMPFAAAQAQNYIGISGGLMSYSAGNRRKWTAKALRLSPAVNLTRLLR